LPDVNVWLAFAVLGHVHHDEAKRWFDQAATDRFAFCRITEMGF
jgi:predicted nucleic acid-binding protein